VRESNQAAGGTTQACRTSL